MKRVKILKVLWSAVGKQIMSILYISRYTYTQKKPQIFIIITSDYALLHFQNVDILQNLEIHFLRLQYLPSLCSRQKNNHIF